MSSNGAECGLHSAPLSMPQKGSPKRWEDKQEEGNEGSAWVSHCPVVNTVNPSLLGG